MSATDWLSYSLQDFIMFGPQVFLRLFVRINQDVWPWTLLALLVSIVVPVLLLSDRLAYRRLAMGLVSVAWIASGYGFLVSYFGPINWPAQWFGWAFVVQGGLLGSITLFGDFQRLQLQSGRTARYWLAAVWVVAVLGLPLLTVAQSGDWKGLGLFGLAPGTTAAASMLVTGLLPGLWRGVYLAVALLWSLFIAATFWALQTWWLLGLPAATLMFAAISFWLSPNQGQSRD